MHYSAVRARLLASGSTSESLLAFLGGGAPPSPEAENVEPPRKRRKVTRKVAADPQSNPFHNWEDALTLALVDIELDLAENVQAESTPSSPKHFLEGRKAVHLSMMNKVYLGDFQCKLHSVNGEHLANIVFPLSLPSRTFDILKQATYLKHPDKRSYAKATFFISRNMDLNFKTSGSRYRLEARIIWRNSRSLSEALTDRRVDILKLCAPEGQAEAQKPWSPRDFYDCVHVPDRNSMGAESLEVDHLNCQLYPFQKRAVQWMLRREQVDVHGNEIGNDDHSFTPGELLHGFYQTMDADGRECFISHALGIVTTAHELLEEAGLRIRGGILAEEMGLGKTVEILALICLHQRSLSAQDDEGNSASLWRSSATLIITPLSILQQWKNEIHDLAPTLKAMVYEGTRSESWKADNAELIKRLLEHDIVLTTYHTLASEIHYSGVTSDRGLRHEKKYERRQSPLVQIDWWRVVLDECQMIESGVSNAGKVAQLIPRQNAWAVSGTPLKKDAKDLLGLLVFLRCDPYCNSSQLWQRVVTKDIKPFKQLFAAIALRHTKEQVKLDIQLPAQKRVVLTVPFTQIEEQHYSNMYQQMCEDCGLDADGAPLTDDWNPECSTVVEKMRAWLTRLRQTCLHPEVGDRNRRALGHGDGPLRTVSEVLEVMMEQNDTVTRTEERSCLLSQIRRGQLLEHAEHSQKALQIWLDALKQSKAIVDDCRQQLCSDTDTLRPLESLSNSVQEQEMDGATTARTGMLSLRLRSALEVCHTCTFFVANAYYQLKTDDTITESGSERFQQLERAEEEAYETAKILRKEMLTETHNKADVLMDSIKSKAQSRSYVQIPSITPLNTSGGIESRNTLAKLEGLSDIMDEQAKQLDEWREKMIELLSSSLVDQEDSDLRGDEYETSTKQQDEIYVYMEALRAMVADRHDALTGQTNLLITRDLNLAFEQAREGAGHSPELLKQLLAVRATVKPRPHHGSIRAIISELRTLKMTLRGLEERGSTRASAEIAILNHALQNLQSDASEQAKVVTSLERELDLFRDTMNARLEYYRQLQTISDAVAPYEEDLDEETLARTLTEMEEHENRLQARISTLKARGRYLVHLRDESTTDVAQRFCIICQQPFEVGALTSCGHSYCKECLRLWWKTHRNCPTCKKTLSRNDFHQITYKPQEMTMQEETQSKGSDTNSETESISIYSGISNTTLNQIKNIDVDGSFGTKIDTLARHILWIREHDPGAKSIVFSQFRDFLDILARAFGQFKIGHTSIDKKDGVEKFRKDPSIECFFLHAKAHSSGLNLVNATHVFLCEPLINTAIELQAIARVHRIGQHHPTTVWMYLVEDTVEKAIYDISVTRRLSHIGRSTHRVAGGDSDSRDLDESDIEAANSLELQEAPLSKLLTKGPGGGEMVEKKDLWNCLFRQKAPLRETVSEEAEREVTSYLGAVAAEERNMR